MADIFICYSSKDRQQAEQLTELLASAGLSVWIDKQDIDVATSWSAEIVDAIDGCHAMIVMLSPASNESKNVAKEVALAAERNKKILPLDLEPVILSRELAYHLAGLQRAPMTNIDSILRALKKYGLEASAAPSMTFVKQSDGRKTLMILPFEDLSPSGDNQWFADGIVSELISALSNIKSLRVNDIQTTKEFQNFTGHLATYAMEMSIRYFVQGDVRKFGDQIKISSRLLDIETGDYLWQDSLKGTMEDVFSIQETVAKQLVAGLEVIITIEEKQKLEQKPTDNIEAYELFLKGQEYGTKRTAASMLVAIELFEQCVQLSPSFTDAYIYIASNCMLYYQNFSRDPVWLAKARKNIDTAQELEGESATILAVRSGIARHEGNREQGLEFAKEAVERDPKSAYAWSVLGTAYYSLQKMLEAAEAWGHLCQLRDKSYGDHFNYIIAVRLLGDRDRLKEASQTALPVFERQLRLTPDDIVCRVKYAAVLGYAGFQQRQFEEIKRVLKAEHIDALTYVHLGCIYLDEGMLERVVPFFRKAVAKGYRNIDYFLNDPDLAPLRHTPEFESFMKELREKVAQEEHG